MITKTIFTRYIQEINGIYDKKPGILSVCEFIYYSHKRQVEVVRLDLRCDHTIK